MTTIINLMPYYSLATNGVIHVGANVGEEVDLYANNGIKHGIYIEPIPEIYSRLEENCRKYSKHTPINALVSNRNGETIEFNISTNSGQSSSIFEFGTHLDSHPQVGYSEKLSLATTTLDSLLAENFTTENLSVFDSLVIDTQGAELKVLEGARLILRQIKFAMIEVSDEEVYKGGALFSDVECFMEEHGFSLVHLFINHYNWGDGFFVRNEFL